MLNNGIQAATKKGKENFITHNRLYLCSSGEQNFVSQIWLSGSTFNIWNLSLFFHTCYKSMLKWTGRFLNRVCLRVRSDVKCCSHAHISSLSQHLISNKIMWFWIALSDAADCTRRRILHQADARTSGEWFYPREQRESRECTFCSYTLTFFFIFT